MSLRPANEGDRDAVLALGVAEETAWFGEPEVSAAEVGEWIDEEGGIAAGVVAVDEQRRVRGFAAPGGHAAVLLADPVAIDALADELLPWLRDRSEALLLQTFAGDRARIAALQRNGLRRMWSTYSLLRPATAGPLPGAVFPAGVDVARYELGDDDEAVHRLIYVDAAWAAVPGHTERTLTAWRETVRPCGSTFLARRGQRPVGWVSARVLDSGRGYIQTVAVATDERGAGLGRALLLHAFADLERAGAHDQSLAVVAGNEAALALYRSLGLEVEREWLTFGRA